MFLRVGLDPADGPVVTVHVLADGTYTPVATLTAGVPGRLAAPYPVSLDPGALLGRRSQG